MSAVIIEPREHENLAGVLNNMAWVYGNTSVSLYIFHGTKNEQFVKDTVKGWTDVQFVNIGKETLHYPGAP